MKIVQINCVFGEGSTGKIVAAIYDYTKSKGDESYVLYGMGKRRKDNHLIRTTPWIVRKAQSFRSRITGYPYGGCIWGTAKAIRTLEKIKPDIVHIQCANGYMVNIYRLLEYLKKKNISTIITNHAEFMYTGGCIHTVDCDKWLTGCFDCKKINKEHPISYFFDRTEKEWNLLKKAYTDFDKLTICCVSDWTRIRASKSQFFFGRPVITILNGIDTDIFHYSDSSELQKMFGYDYKKIVIHVTPDFYSIIKGGIHVLEMARRLPDVLFIIVGSEAKDTVPTNCHFVGTIIDQRTLAQFYSLADVCLLTSVRETFSMVCAESLCCGTPVVGFKAGGPESIAVSEYSIFVERNNDKLEKALRTMLDKQYSKKEVSDISKSIYDQNTMCEAYYNLYKNLSL